MDKNLYNYKAKLIKVIDGDTIDVQIDLGFDVHTNQRVRLYNIDAPETKTKNLLEKRAGLHVKLLVEVILINKDLYIKTIKTNDKFGRYLADVYFDKLDNSEFVSLSQLLIDKKFVKQYSGDTKKEEWTDEELSFILGEESQNKMGCTKQEKELLQNMYPEGTIVELIEMDDTYTKIPSGTRGKVSHIDDIGTIHVKWDNGSSLGLINGVDKFKKI